MKRIDVLAAIGACTLVACGNDSNTGPGTGMPAVQIVPAFPKLTFSRPTDVQNAGDGSDRIFVVEQTGQIVVFPNRADVDSVSTFLDISSEVNYESQSEEGLLGLAFHPDYKNNGYFFVAYTTGTPTARAGRISRFRVGLGPNSADASSEKVMLEFHDDFPNHNGGGMCFGADGYLYVGIGDEGGAGDPNNNAQDRSRIFGKILRLDVNQNVDTPPYYGIPADNPYAGNSDGYLEEIWAYGLRNPWRINFDAQTGLLIAGDVGQRTWEEIDIITGGGNYGWDCREGFNAYDQNENASSPLCATAGPFTDPIYVYDHTQGKSITGGYVYRGTAVPEWRGKYVFGDFTLGRIWALDLFTHEPTAPVNTGQFISTFGVAQNGELLVATYFADGSPSALYHLRVTP
ncbi:MAG TPA: PQQ-dependent sugar dehydrogenase [Candidatus Krumholzibacteria bacterium]|nr:PQQ-dependent sugar dehydrogenase [Candidatus Krumholzibacteria bacterium]